MIETKKKHKQEEVISINGITVKVSTEKVFDGEGDFVVVEITNPQGKRLMVKTPPREWRLPPGVYC